MLCILGKSMRSAGPAKACAAVCEVVEMVTDDQTCIDSDRSLELPVRNDAIIQMAMQRGYWKPRKGYVICDIDGTLADIAHRRHFVTAAPKDWQAFFAAMGADRPRQEVIELVRQFHRQGYDLVLVSGRPEDYRALTETWLAGIFQGDMPYQTLLMRKSGDRRPDTEVKQEILEQYFPDRSLIHTVIDDRPSVIHMWRKRGLNVIDVGTGEEF
jgi:phosphoglycolate phosphatase-like HAD superfamily hydrolase